MSLIATAEILNALRGLDSYLIVIETKGHKPNHRLLLNNGKLHDLIVSTSFRGKRQEVAELSTKALGYKEGPGGEVDGHVVTDPGAPVVKDYTLPAEGHHPVLKLRLILRPTAPRAV